MKYLLTLLAIALLSGCDPKPSNLWEVTAPQPIPNTDCTYQYVDRGNGSTGFRMVRCPQQTVTIQYQCGKDCIDRVAVEEQAPANLTCEHNSDDTYTCTNN